MVRLSILTVLRVMEIAEGMEAAEKNTQQLKGSEAVVQLGARAKMIDEQPCYCCGRRNHSPAECCFKGTTCHFCCRKGHIARVCLLKKIELQEVGKKQKRKFHRLRQQGKTKEGAAEVCWRPGDRGTTFVPD